MLRQHPPTLHLALVGAAWLLVAGALTSTTAAAQGSEERVEKYKDWSVQCLPIGTDDSTKRCVMGVMVSAPTGEDKKTRPMMRLVIARSDDKKQAQMEVKLPLGVLLPAGIAMKVDKGEEIRAQYAFCDRAGCNAVLNLDNTLLGAMRRGNQLQIAFADAGGGQGALPVSLSGFTAAFNRLAKIKP